MTKVISWHINAAGEVVRCRARFRSCPRAHYNSARPSRKEASEAKKISRQEASEAKKISSQKTSDTKTTSESNSYGSYSPDMSLVREQYDKPLDQAVEQQDFGVFISLSDDKKRQQDRITSQELVESKAENNSDISVKEYRSIGPDVKKNSEYTEELKLKIQNRLQNPEWDGNTAEIISMYYVKTIENIKAKKDTTDPVQKISAVYEERYAMDMISSLTNQAEFNSEGKLAINEKKLEKMISMRTKICSEAYEKSRQETVERENGKYGNFFSSDRSPRDVANAFKAISNQQAIQYIEKLTSQSYDDEKWGTYRDKVTLTDVVSI